jgi:DNA-binding MarR family transcriptional regulator
VTGLLGRLERKGFARRIPNPDDRRSVLVEMVYERMGTMGPHFFDLARQLHLLYDTFEEAELRAIARFLTEAAKIQQEAAGKIPSPEEPTAIAP